MQHRCAVLPLRPVGWHTGCHRRLERAWRRSIGHLHAGHLTTGCIYLHGRGYGTEALQLLVGYGFDVLGLHRLQIETLADNAAMIGSAESAGFRLEGRLRGSGWVLGEFVDEVVLGLVREG